MLSEMRRLTTFSCFLLLAACGEPPSTDCATEGCADPARTCVPHDDGSATCECADDTVDVGGECVEPDECMEGECGEHGRCEAGTCVCDAGHIGARCERCAEGLHGDGAGGCTDDVCLPDPCDPGRRCVAVEGEATCRCPAGQHDEDGACVPDTTCMEESCAGHGVCDDAGGSVSCACEAGWGGAYCDACDEAGGWHADGAGGCTMDACLPNPCTAPDRGVCTIDETEGVICSCDPGFHDDGSGGCVADEVCTADRCGAHGVCAEIGGVTECTCDAGWTDDACDACDAAAGYHDDGMGGCTTDVCLPNPCATPNRSVCADVGGVAECSCDPGYHPDGVGGCTMDPCIPDPCAGTGQLCREVAGMAECYTPACDDGNPCTDDAFDGAACVFSPRADGSSCSTTVCQSGQTCTASVCGGGSAVSCDDANPCTDDACDAVTGCSNVVDDTNVPDDGLACTEDVCAAGVASSTPRDARCDDGLWCTGTEVCLPGDARADASGCVAEAAPTAPGPDGPCGTWSCVEASRSWSLSAVSAGSACDDGIACTTGDACSGDGACRGAVTAACRAGATAACTTTRPLGASVDIPRASVRGALSFEGATPVGSGSDDEVNLWLQNQHTGSLVHLEQIDFTSWDGARYPVRSWDFRDDHAIDLDVLPGTYDLIYQRFWGSGDATRDWGGAPDGTYPFGSHVWRADIVLGPGTNTLDVDLPRARISGALTFDGGAPTGSGADDEVNLWLRDTRTGSLVHLEQIDFTSWDGAQYPVRSWDFRDDHAIDLDVLPGTYDILYQRFWGSGDASRDWGGAPDRTYPFGSHVLRRDVVFGPGVNTLDVDIPTARVTGSLTFDGAAPVGSGSDDEVNLWLRDTRTGSLVHLEQIDFTSWDGAQYPVRSWDFRDDHVIDLDVLPGTYDVIYQRFWGSGDADRDWGGAPDGTYPFGSHVLMEGVVLGPGVNTLDVDIPRASVMGTLTFAGGPAVGSGADDEVNLWLRDTRTGSLVHLEQIDFTSWDGAQYPVRSWDFRDDRVIALDVLPGTYDLVYRRFWGSGDADRDWGGAPDGTYPFGSHVLRAGIVIAPGANTLDVDIPRASVMGALTFAGGPAVGSGADDEVNLWLRDTPTGSLVHLEQIDFTSWDGAQYPVRSWDFRDDRVIALDVLPGTYDVLVRRFWGSGDALRDWGGAPDGTYPFGSHVLMSSVVIGPGSNALNVDVPRASVSGVLTFAGAAPVGSGSDDEVNVWLRDRATGSLVHLEQVDFASWDGSRYPVRSWDFRDDHVVDLDVAPGSYDLVYRRFWGSGDASRDWGGAPDGTYPFGSQLLRECVSLP
ncbi:MAG: hypothetical protein SangKO_007770 [Sandaracinaceae bacterium]